ncbi:MAG: SRPBCC domain-containing protein [Dehalococcoidia bacterium]
MPQIVTHTDIHAAAEDVWSVLTDFEQYDDWNPFVRSVEGRSNPGGQLEVLIAPPGGRAMTFRPEVLVRDEAREFRWLGRTRAAFIKLVDGEHYFQIEPIEPGRVRFTHGERFTGLLASPMMWFVGGQTRRGFEAMNAALKARVEQAA